MDALRMRNKNTALIFWYQLRRRRTQRLAKYAVLSTLCRYVIETCQFSPAKIIFQKLMYPLHSICFHKLLQIEGSVSCFHMIPSLEFPIVIGTESISTNVPAIAGPSHPSSRPSSQAIDHKLNQQHSPSAPFVPTPARVPPVAPTASPASPAVGSPVSAPIAQPDLGKRIVHEYLLGLVRSGCI